MTVTFSTAPAFGATWMSLTKTAKTAGGYLLNTPSYHCAWNHFLTFTIFNHNHTMSSGYPDGQKLYEQFDLMKRTKNEVDRKCGD